MLGSTGKTKNKAVSKHIKKQPKKKKNNTISFFWPVFSLIILINVFFVVRIQFAKNELIYQFEEVVKVEKSIAELKDVMRTIPQLLAKYGYTLHSSFLQNYWYQLNYGTNINGLLSQLGNDSISSNLIDRIETSNRNIRNEEIHSLKLIFSAYRIPDEVITPSVNAFLLSDAEIAMADKDKLQLAKDILYSMKRETAQQQLQNNLDKLGNHLSEKLSLEITESRQRMSASINFLYLLDFVGLIFIVTRFWKTLKKGELSE